MIEEIYILSLSNEENEYYELENNSGCCSNELPSEELTPNQIHKEKNGLRVKGQVTLRGKRNNKVIIIPEDRYTYTATGPGAAGQDPIELYGSSTSTEMSSTIKSMFGDIIRSLVSRSVPKNESIDVITDDKDFVTADDKTTDVQTVKEIQDCTSTSLAKSKSMKVQQGKLKNAFSKFTICFGMSKSNRKEHIVTENIETITDSEIDKISNEDEERLSAIEIGEQDNLNTAILLCENIYDNSGDKNCAQGEMPLKKLKKSKNSSKLNQDLTTSFKPVIFKIDSKDITLHENIILENVKEDINNNSTNQTTNYYNSGNKPMFMENNNNIYQTISTPTSTYERVHVCQNHNASHSKCFTNCKMSYSKFLNIPPPVSQNSLSSSKKCSHSLCTSRTIKPEKCAGRCQDNRLNEHQNKCSKSHNSQKLSKNGGFDFGHVPEYSLGCHDSVHDDKISGSPHLDEIPIVFVSPIRANNDTKTCEERLNYVIAEETVQIDENIKQKGSAVNHESVIETGKCCPERSLNSQMASTSLMRDIPRVYSNKEVKHNSGLPEQASRLIYENIDPIVVSPTEITIVQNLCKTDQVKCSTAVTMTKPLHGEVCSTDCQNVTEAPVPKITKDVVSVSISTHFTSIPNLSNTYHDNPVKNTYDKNRPMIQKPILVSNTIAKESYSQKDTSLEISDLIPSDQQIPTISKNSRNDSIVVSLNTKPKRNTKSSEPVPIVQYLSSNSQRNDLDIKSIVIFPSDHRAINVINNIYTENVIPPSIIDNDTNRCLQPRSYSNHDIPHVTFQNSPTSKPGSNCQHLSDLKCRNCVSEDDTYKPIDKILPENMKCEDMCYNEIKLVKQPLQIMSKISENNVSIQQYVKLFPKTSGSINFDTSVKVDFPNVHKELLPLNLNDGNKINQHTEIISDLSLGKDTNIQVHSFIESQLNILTEEFSHSLSVIVEYNKSIEACVHDPQYKLERVKKNKLSTFACGHHHSFENTTAQIADIENESVDVIFEDIPYHMTVVDDSDHQESENKQHIGGSDHKSAEEIVLNGDLCSKIYSGIPVIDSKQKDIERSFVEERFEVVPRRKDSKCDSTSCDSQYSDKSQTKCSKERLRAYYAFLNRCNERLYQMDHRMMCCYQSFPCLAIDGVISNTCKCKSRQAFKDPKNLMIHCNSMIPEEIPRIKCKTNKDIDLNANNKGMIVKSTCRITNEHQTSLSNRDRSTITYLKELNNFNVKKYSINEMVYVNNRRTNSISNFNFTTNNCEYNSHPRFGNPCKIDYNNKNEICPREHFLCRCICKLPDVAIPQINSTNIRPNEYQPIRCLPYCNTKTLCSPKRRERLPRFSILISNRCSSKKLPKIKTKSEHEHLLPKLTLIKSQHKSKSTFGKTTKSAVTTNYFTAIETATNDYNLEEVTSKDVNEIPGSTNVSVYETQLSRPTANYYTSKGQSTKSVEEHKPIFQFTSVPTNPSRLTTAYFTVNEPSTATMDQYNLPDDTKDIKIENLISRSTDLISMITTAYFTAITPSNSTIEQYIELNKNEMEKEM